MLPSMPQLLQDAKIPQIRRERNSRDSSCTEFRVDLGFMSWGGGLAEKRGM